MNKSIFYYFHYFFFYYLFPQKRKIQVVYYCILKPTEKLYGNVDKFLKTKRK